MDPRTFEKKRTLVYIANARIPTEKAHGLQIMKMCEAFAAVGLKVELIYPKRINPLGEDPLDYYGMSHSFIMTVLPSIDLVRFGKIGYFVSTISFLWGARQCLINKEYDIIYTREPLALLFFPGAALELLDLPLKIGFFRRWLWDKARAIAVLTKLMREDLIRSGISEGKLLVTPDGVDLSLFDVGTSKEEARRILGLPLDKKIILYAGSFFRYLWKGTDVLLEAVKLLSENQVVVLVGGEGAEISKIQQEPTPPQPFSFGPTAAYPDSLFFESCGSFGDPQS